MGMNKRIFHALLEWAAGGRIKLCTPLSRNGRIPSWGRAFTLEIAGVLHDMPPLTTQSTASATRAVPGPAGRPCRRGPSRLTGEKTAR